MSQIYSIQKDFQINDKKGTYYQLYGGGPEGGLFLDTDDNIWYEIDRTWFEPWTIKRLTSNIPIKIYKDKYDFWYMDRENDEE